jgi:DNA-binding FadR family transcriptional regulator
MTTNVRIKRKSSRQPGAAAAIAETAKRILGWIESAQYPLHTRLPPERELAATLAIPRSRLREALRILEDEGRIWRNVGMGTFVGGRPRSVGSGAEALGSATTLAEILEARSFIEPIVARLAAQRAEESEITAIEHYAATAAKATNWEHWERWDDLLHRAIAEASGNGLLINIIDQLFRIKMHPRWSVRQAATFDAALIERYANEHRAVISHIIGRDGEGAELAMKRHMLGLTLTVGPAISVGRKAAASAPSSPAPVRSEPR